MSHSHHQQQDADPAVREIQVEVGALVLSAVIEDAAPDLPAIAASIPIEWVFERDADRPSRAAHRVTTVLHPELGVLLHGHPRELDDPGAPRGSYSGDALHLLADGRLLALTYTGSWSEGFAHLRATARELSVEEAARAFPVGECVRTLELALERGAAPGGGGGP